jgi:2-oxoisovalerate dehydrogenase E1 component
MLEPKALFASKGEVPVEEYFVPFGEARIARAGKDITIVSAGQQVPKSLEAAEALAAEGIEAEVIDLRTIMPLDIDTIVASVKRTHRLLVVDEAWAMCGIGGEIAQSINELAYDELDAPPGRVHTLPTAHPFAPVLERAMLVDAPRVVQAARDVIAGRPPVPDHWYAGAGRGEAPAAAVQPAPKTATPGPAPSPQAASEAKPAAEGEPITMPFGDLTVSEGKLIKWHKAVGDAVTVGVVVAEIETDKAVVEIDAPAAGTVAAIEQPVGAVVPMGGRIGVIRP